MDMIDNGKGHGARARPGVAEDLNETSFTPKNILVTGGAGFIASHVTIHLVRNYPDYNVSLD